MLSFLLFLVISELLYKNHLKDLIFLIAYTFRLFKIENNTYFLLNTQKKNPNQLIKKQKIVVMIGILNILFF